MIASGSYDHFVRLWDTRSSDHPILKLDHEAPVESLFLYGNGSMAISTGSNYIRIWDILSGGKLLKTVSHHQKTITCIKYDNERKRILTGGLDRQLQILSMDNFEVEANLSYPDPILCFDLAPNHSHLVVGMTSGLVSIKRRQIENHKAENENSKSIIRSNTHQYYMRGVDNSLDHHVLEKHAYMCTFIFI